MQHTYSGNVDENVLEINGTAERTTVKVVIQYSTGAQHPP